MKKEKVYFDTSVPSAYYDKRTKERLVLTKDFWKKINIYNCYISTLVIDELNQVSSKDLKDKLLALVNDCSILQVDSEVEILAENYVKAEIIPQKYFSDALHIAVATVNQINFLVSWNFKHFVNVKTRQKVNLVNQKRGYRVIEIIAPPEL